MLLYCYIATQGRIQDLKLGVAQMHFEKIEKPGGGGGTNILKIGRGGGVRIY